MDLRHHNIIITGGTTGIGLALAERFLDLGNTVLVVDYSVQHLVEAKQKRPDLLTYRADLSNPDLREEFADWVTAHFKEVDMLINNAGIQRWINLTNIKHDWAWYHRELAINLEAQLHLTMLLLPTIVAKFEGAIVNVSSGLVINNGSWVPLYSASKSGVHGFTQALRHQLEDTKAHVFEILPPAVNTNLGGSGEHEYGSDLNQFVDAVFEQLAGDVPEITFATSWDQLRASKQVNEKTTEETWQLFKNNPTFKNA
ncbi:SDR family NAD(P)-dependent oxidoreductase [uncultured Secundilactobacillus sp.]|uniref:SDR family NAD(P)-dependent oxidoreductase n=1 Tax=uncultured Secundilactobacillus sp. TaxID=2813935 RepID=UPI00258E8E40|nr:SDR family NAD(P)-dependent oxidoreductase [uncultured Secundilactobacillus sp.]